MEDVVKAFEKPSGGYHIIVFDNELHDSETIVLDATKVKKYNQEILNRFKIAKDRSDDLKNI